MKEWYPIPIQYVHIRKIGTILNIKDYLKNPIGCTVQVVSLPSEITSAEIVNNDLRYQISDAVSSTQFRLILSSTWIEYGKRVVANRIIEFEILRGVGGEIGDGELIPGEDADEEDAPKGESAVGYTGDYTPGADADEEDAPKGESAIGYTGDLFPGADADEEDAEKGESAIGYTGDYTPGVMHGRKMPKKASQR